MQEKTKNFFKDKRTRIAIAVIVAIIVIIAGYYFVIFQVQWQGRANTINLQNKCAAQAQKVFSLTQNANSSINYTYQNHYSFNLGKCYVLLYGVGVNGIGTSDKLMDAYANTDIADCESYATAPESNSCVFNGSNSPYNINAFNDFVKPYMETE